MQAPVPIPKTTIRAIEEALKRSALEGANTSEPLVTTGILQRIGDYLELSLATYKTLKTQKNGKRAIYLARDNQREAAIPKELAARRLEYRKLTGAESSRYPHAILTKNEFAEIRQGTIDMASAVWGEIHELTISHACANTNPEQHGELLLLATGPDKVQKVYKSETDDTFWAEPIKGTPDELSKLQEQIKTEATARALELAQTQYCIVPQDRL